MHILKDPRFTTYSAWGIIVLGVILRLRQYLLNRSLWLDEAMLALNIVQRNFKELTYPLNYDQGAPLGFLWLTKIVELTLGNRVFALRLIPLLAGIASLVLLYFLLRRAVSPGAGLFALAIASISSYWISFSAQVKQYSSDAAITLGLYLLALGYFDRKPSDREYAFLALAGSLAIWMSHPAVFTLGGIGLVLIGQTVLERNWKETFKRALVIVAWLANFSILYFVQYQNLNANKDLTGFWAELFLPAGDLRVIPGWFLFRFEEIFYNPLGFSKFTQGIVLMILFLMGGFWLWHSNRAWTLIYLLTLGLSLIASALGKYPFGARLALFITPGLMVFLAAGLDTVRVMLKSRPLIGSILAIAISGYLLYIPASFALETFINPKMTENIAPTMSYLKDNYKDGDVIYLYGSAVPAYLYYAPKYGLENAVRVESVRSPQQPENYLRELDQLKGQTRVWVLFSHVTETSFLNEKDYILEYLNKIGEKKRQVGFPGTSVYLYLYDLR